MASLYPIPSFATGFARNASQSLFPNLWKGLVGLWASYVGVQGQTLYDWSGNRNDGVLTNMNNNNWVPGRDGWALGVDGISQHITVANRPNLSGMAKLTAVCVFKLDQLSSVKGETEEFIRKRHIGAPFSSYKLMTTGFTDSFVFQITNSSSVVKTVSHGSTLSINTWYCGVGVYDGANIIAYLNGVPGSPIAQTGDVFVSNNVLSIGAATPTSFRLDGQINLIIIYDRALLPQEIALLYAIPHASLILKDDLMAFLPGIADLIALEGFEVPGRLGGFETPGRPGGFETPGRPNYVV